MKEEKVVVTCLFLFSCFEEQNRAGDIATT